jgi:hypothetical protein|nr:MAG TPA: hypothetical protein [Caudoviricetes sp.]
MIEVFNMERTENFGRFVNFKAAKDTLNELAISGKLGEEPAALVCSYKNDKPQREYVATYAGKWRIPKMPQTPQPTNSVVSKKRRKRKLCKVYKSPEHCFREGFPDWMNRSYPVPVLKRQGMDVRRNIHAHTW